MTNTEKVPSNYTDSASLLKRMLQGAAVALVLIIIFLSGEIHADPSWGKYWIIRPLVIVPIAGAMGGAYFYYMGYLRQMDGWIKVLAIIFSVLGYIIALWLGTVLGLAGTLWN